MSKAQLSKSGRVTLIGLCSAHEFLDVLRPTSGLFTGGEFFRGHGDATWPLLPSAFRQILRGRTNGVTASSTYMEVVEWEAQVLLNFLKGLDDHGYSAPGAGDNPMSEALAILYADQTKKPYDDWPMDGVLRALALAQHNGVPTRLLDWTSRSDVAAYFAARDCLVSETTPQNLAVWAVRDRGVRNWDPHHSLKIRGFPQYENDNLRAQAGVMMVFKQFEDYHSPFKPTSFDLSDSATFGGDESQGLAYWKVTLPAGEAPTLLRLLYAKSIHGATMFPNLSGVARLAVERDFWARDDNPSWLTVESHRQVQRQGLLDHLGLSIDLE